MTSKKKITIGIVVVVIVFGVFGVMKAKEYYDNTYVGETYYGQILSNQPLEPQKLVGSGGENYSAIDYVFKAYNKNGDEVVASFEKDDVNNAYKPNAYIMVEQSKTRTVYDKEVSREEIPKDVLKYTDEEHK